ncbi:MAG TPA: dihydropteroate synthase [Edaphocola sp.]|nr:dihydropteroate synthase [Edaphocola sp.]
MIPSFNLQGTLMNFESPKVMGILNITPDSFYNKGRNSSFTEAIHLADRMIKEGADILDIGGQSSRPGSERVGAEEEINRVCPIIEAIHQRFPKTPISIDTYYAKVAKKAVAAGAVIVNDISAGLMDEKMLPTISKLEVSYIMMHMQGTPENMQKNPKYDDVVVEVFDFLKDRILAAKSLGIKDIAIDLGFGFGKTLEQNYILLRTLKAFQMLNAPILVGVSRKSMIYRHLGIDPDDALNGTTAVHILALEQGAQILRVHDVKEAKEAIQIYELYKKAGTGQKIETKLII